MYCENSAANDNIILSNSAALHQHSQDFCLEEGARPTPPSHASVVHTFEAVTSSRGSVSDVSTPAISRVMGGVRERNKNCKKNIGEMTFGGGFL